MEEGVSSPVFKTNTSKHTNMKKAIMLAVIAAMPMLAAPQGAPQGPQGHQGGPQGGHRGCCKQGA